MNSLTAIPMFFDAIINLAVSAMTALAHRALIVALAALLISGTLIFAVSGFAWLWLKQAGADLLHLRPAAPAS